MRPSLLPATLAAALLLSAAPAAAARTAAAPADDLTIDATAPLAAGHPTLTGTYRCAPASGTTFLAASLSQADPHVRHGIGSTPAVCDGALHRWTRTDTGTRTYAAGEARVQVSLVELSATGLPLPRVHRIEERTVTLVAAR
ncbi:MULTISPECIES: DUF6299 family protein [unclassified Streptomyces]|uniref:DUF6299 family protein n=1 Tax=unclassified Streptomyces TaxID=2593676 RepID=UPI0004BE65EE|nr:MULTISPECIES: DUF6299 family protein [unclassified Streptomyces]